MISVIMPTIRTEWIRESIKSFIEQDYVDKELIIINDGADIDYESILNEFDRTQIRYIKLNTRISIGEVMNVGIKEANGDLICPLHDDDTFTMDSLKYRTGINAEVVWADNYKMSLTGVIGDRRIAESPDKNKIWKIDYINMTTMMWKKSVHGKIGYFADMSHDEDWHFKIRCLMECECAIINEPVMNYRIHSGQYSAIGRQQGITQKEEQLMWIEMKKRYNR